MAVTFILGRAGTGKTHACVQAVLEALSRENDAHRLILLVPEQASFQMERTLAVRAPRGGYSRAAVLSFSRLARQVFDATGPEPVLLDATTRTLALRGIVARQIDELKVLHRAARTAGFCTQLNRLFEELLREDVSPAVLEAAAAQCSDGYAARKTRELVRLYAAYLDWLGPQRTDGAAQLSLLCERLERLSWMRSASVWVDGFAGFTGQELGVLVKLARLASDVTITLLLDANAPAVRQPERLPDLFGLFQRTELTYQRLRARLREVGVQIAAPVRLCPPIPPRFSEASSLAALEIGLATPIGTGGDASVSSSADTGGADAVRLRACATHRDELAAVARWIRTSITDSGGTLRYRDFAVIARDLEPFATMVAEVFADYELPYFLDRRRSMRGHPLSTLIPAAFDAVSSDFDVAAMTRLLRTRLLPLGREAAEALENLVVQESLAGAAYWPAAANGADAMEPVPRALHAERCRIATALEPLRVLVQRAEPAPGAVWMVAVQEVLARLGVRECIVSWITDAREARRWESAELHRLAWDALCDLLDDFHAVLGDAPLDATDVQALLQGGLAEMTLGLAPPTVDQVLVSSIERSRHPDIQYAWVFAFNEGIFPAPPGDDALLSSAERTALSEAGLAAPAARRADVLGERLLAYIALTRPARGLTISFATVGDGGEALLPSPLLTDVRRALPGLVVESTSDHPPPTCLPELAAGYLDARREAPASGLRWRYERLLELLRADTVQAERLRWLLRGLEYRNTPEPVGNYRCRSNAPDVAWDSSVSEIEIYLQCPFQHFLSFGLGLDAERGPLPVRWDLGSAAHEILADVTRCGMRTAGSVRALSSADWQALLEEAVRAHWQRQPADLGQRRPDVVSLAAVLNRFLADVVAVNSARWRRGRFEPWCCEQVFGRGATEREGWQAVELDLPNGERVCVHGQIDRVDLCRDAEPPLALVYDYKSSSGAVKGGVLTGRSLQLFIYLLAVRQALTGAEGGRVAGVLITPLYPDFDVLGRKYGQEVSEDEQLMFLYRPRGLFDAAAAPMLDGQLGSGQSSVANMRLTKGGDFYANSDVVAADQIDARLTLAEETVRLAASGVCAGRIEIEPLVIAKRLACRDCAFQSVCRFERAYNRPRAVESALPHLVASLGDSDNGGDAA